MTDKKPILAILGGTGKEGPGLATRWARAGYRVVIGSRQLEKAQQTAQQINTALGLDGVTGMLNAQAAQSADVCVLTVVSSAHQQVVEGLKNDLQGKILVDATARVDFRQPSPPAPPSAARWAQDCLGPGVRVVAAFQNVPAHALKADLDKPLASDVLVCSDDVEAAEQVIVMAEAAGMRAYYAGNLDNAVVVEGITALLIQVNKHYATRRAGVRLTGVGEPGS
jgi:NADPH-dependent F420 reductase